MSRPSRASARRSRTGRTFRRAGVPFLALAALLLVLGFRPPAQAATPFFVEPPPPALARIYFYRQAKPLMVALTPEVIVNGKSVGDLSMGEVFFRDARPGRYRVFLSGDPAHVLEFTLAEGEIAFVRATLRLGLGSTRISAERIGQATAVAEIDQMDAPTATEPQTTHR